MLVVENFVVDGLYVSHGNLVDTDSTVDQKTQNEGFPDLQRVR